MHLKWFVSVAIAVSFFSGCAQRAAAPKSSIPGGLTDFVERIPPTYDATARANGYEGRGIFQIEYRAGKIVNVFAVKSTGEPYLDAKTIGHIRSFYRVKPGVSGTVRQPISYRLGRSARKGTPVHPFQYDAEAIKRRYEGQGKFQIAYKSGQIVSVRTLKSTGVPYLDAKTIREIHQFLRPKSNESGTAVLPVTYRLTQVPPTLNQ